MLFIREAMSVAISAETSHSPAENSQLGQNILYKKNKSTCLWLSPHYRVYYAKESGCYSLVCEWCKWQEEARLITIPDATIRNLQSQVSPHFNLNQLIIRSTASYFLKMRMAMTMLMMSSTASTGPMTHSISDCSIPWAILEATSIGSE